MSGQSASLKVTRQNFDTMTVRYDPVNKVVTGYFDGILIGTIPYAANGIRFVGFEASRR